MTADDDAILAARARRLAGRPAAAAPVDPVVVLAFTLGDERYALPMARVVEVARYAPPARIPGEPPEILGLVGLRGGSVLAVDLRPIFGLPAVSHGDGARLVGIGRHAVRGDARGDVADLALVVDGADGIDTVDAARLHPPPSTLSPRAARLVHGVDATARVVLDADALLDDPDLFVTDAPEENR